jgi:hypothetical protein
MPISVRIVNPPPAPVQNTSASDALVRQLQAAQDSTGTLVWVAVVFLGLQTLVFLIALYFIIRVANDGRQAVGMAKRTEPSP